jgi:dTDP-L-rhamnose 4-epimerase
LQVDCLITGGAGFIGCALSMQLSSRRGDTYKIVALDNLHPQIHPDQRRPAALAAPVELIVGDAVDPDCWQTLLRQVRPKTIVHLAAETGTGQSLDHPVRHTHANVTGTAFMLEALDRAGHMPDQIILTSSRAIYGEGVWKDPANGDTFSPHHRSRKQLEAGRFGFISPSGADAIPMPHHEKRVPPRPVSIYGATKLAQEHLLAFWAEAREVPLTVLRLQNVYGPGQSPLNSYTGIVGLFHRTAAAGQSIPVYEDGNIGRDFVFVDDVANVIGAALGNPATYGRTLDVGSGVVTTILDAANAIAAIYDAPEPRVTGAYRFGDVRWASCDTADLAAVYRTADMINFSDGNKRLSDWLKSEGAI